MKIHNQKYRIGLIAPADCFPAERLKSAIQNISNGIQGIEFIKAPNLYKRYGMFAGTDADKLADIKYIVNKKPDLIMGVKGGYGSSRLLEKIDYNIIKKNKSIFMGYSDLTALLIAVNQITGLVSHYGFLLNTDFSEKIFNRQAYILKTILKSKKLKYCLNGKIIKDGKLFKKKFTGISIAGCLSILSTLTGVKYFQQYKNENIMFIEDINEEPYKIDRMLVHLKNAGVFNKTRCLFLDFNKCIPSEKNKKTISIKKTIFDIFSDFDFPVIEFNHFGHRANKISIPIGGNSEIELFNNDLKKISQIKPNVKINVTF